MSFDPTACGRALQGVDPSTVRVLRSTAEVLAEKQARIYETRFPWQKRELVGSVGQDLRTFAGQLECARRQSRHPEDLPATGPVRRMSEEELLAWATGFAWSKWNNGRDDG
ncbi:MAG: hypothetical protein PHI73_01545 [Patescibacteria group bacterium]|nr:hypothetical protein [Patescibacteria group bacterium]